MLVIIVLASVDSPPPTAANYLMDEVLGLQIFQFSFFKTVICFQLLFGYVIPSFDHAATQSSKVIFGCLIICIVSFYSSLFVDKLENLCYAKLNKLQLEVHIMRYDCLCSNDTSQQFVCARFRVSRTINCDKFNFCVW